MQIDNQAINRWISYCPKLDTLDIKRLTVLGYDRGQFSTATVRAVATIRAVATVRAVVIISH